MLKVKRNLGLKFFFFYTNKIALLYKQNKGLIMIFFPCLCIYSLTWYCFGLLNHCHAYKRIISTQFMNMRIILFSKFILFPTILIRVVNKKNEEQKSQLYTNKTLSIILSFYQSEKSQTKLCLKG
jgi:hypothetical protein